MGVIKLGVHYRAVTGRFRASISPPQLEASFSSATPGTSQSVHGYLSRGEIVMLTPAQCRALAGEYKSMSQSTTVSKERAFIMSNIARSLMGLATQLDMLAAKMRDEKVDEPLAGRAS
jgi:hypothetical protein